ncbi:hypothetical protein [Aureimonas sp. SK2]|uniref:hypothetical protein n=1 Tax=Aureimonas sp. SK2 TaxID=3015992 RepID=UPI002445037E|nr:hypothetical protein [Aureimonas sp. SK2]
MKISIFASAVAVSLAALTGAASASSIIPGSDYFTEAQADHEANTVIRGETAAAPGATVTETRSFGFPASAGADRNLVPGSRFESRVEQNNSINAVARGDYHGGYTAAPTASVRVVPGSDSF